MEAERDVNMSVERAVQRDVVRDRIIEREVDRVAEGDVVRGRWRYCVCEGG